jgi:hypothetical protein
MKKSETISVAATAATLLAATLLSASAGSAVAASGQSVAVPEERCGRALITSQQQVLRRETALLARCARAMAEQHRNRVIDYRCGRLQRSGIGADRVELIARSRVETQCTATTLPAWFPAGCHARGPEEGSMVSDPSQAASCVLAGGRCLALAATQNLFDAIDEILTQRVPGMLDFELGGIPGHTFAACGQISTTTTMPTAPTTTTTLAEATTTTLPHPTTTTTSTTLPAPEAPSIVITEIMTNPAAQSDTAGEYFEIVNTGSSALDLQGTSFRDLGSNAFTVDEPLLVPAGGRAVLARSSSAGDGLVDYVYGSAMSLGNTSDEIIAERDGTVLDVVSWDASYPLVSGAAMEVISATTDPATNDDPMAWCSSATPLSDGDFGTPGQQPGACTELP